jgi:hypothetical protein
MGHEAEAGDGAGQMGGVGGAAALVGYLSILLLLRLNETRLVYAPGPRRLSPPPAGLGLRPETVEFATEDGVRLVAWVMRPPDTTGHWLLICHGNYGNLSDAGRPAHYEIISGYRSPESNAKMAAASSGVAKQSLHMQGRAIDVRLRGFPTAGLRDLALKAQKGGVGYYQRSDFVHLDTGRFRTWSG